jgi:hypothetical protein
VILHWTVFFLLERGDSASSPSCHQHPFISQTFFHPLSSISFLSRLDIPQPRLLDFAGRRDEVEHHLDPAKSICRAPPIHRPDLPPPRTPLSHPHSAVAAAITEGHLSPTQIPFSFSPSARPLQSWSPHLRPPPLTHRDPAALQQPLTPHSYQQLTHPLTSCDPSTSNTPSLLFLALLSHLADSSVEGMQGGKQHYLHDVPRVGTEKAQEHLRAL